jgi:hypothetical protein
MGSIGAMLGFIFAFIALIYVYTVIGVDSAKLVINMTIWTT